MIPDNQTERTLTAQVKLYYDLHVPATSEANGARPLLLALHGYGGSKRQMMREARQLAPENFCIAALQGVHQHIREPREVGQPLRYGFGWLTSFHSEESVALHHKMVLDVIGRLADEGVADPRRVFLLGFSQSCALNYRFAFTHADILRGVIGMCGGLPGDWETGTQYQRTQASVLHIAGEQDEFYTPSRTSDYKERLMRRAADVEARNYTAGHEITTAMRDDVRNWLAERAA